jgi:hypothetical protein
MAVIADGIRVGVTEALTSRRCLAAVVIGVLWIVLGVLGDGKWWAWAMLISGNVSVTLGVFVPVLGYQMSRSPQDAAPDPSLEPEVLALVHDRIARLDGRITRIVVAQDQCFAGQIRTVRSELSEVLAQLR